MMRYLSLTFLLMYFLSSSYAAPFRVPYRYPTRMEVLHKQNIMISSQPITDTDIFIERGVLEYLVNNNFFKPKWLKQWNNLNQLTILTPKQAIRMMRLKRRQAKAIRRFQRANGLPQTGVIDTPVIRIIFPVTCGTPDYINEPINDGFGDYDDIQENNTTHGHVQKKR